ncbi:pentapeptide repeat-containing protein [Spongiactinospora sp. 9N601]|uniref:pentapeptide repeat-containing protein n=1 Tax=Spongiactinospora sp. 9N601 TaxID=3375149 RepID=UPI0037BE17B5
MWWLLATLPADLPGQPGSARGEALRTALAAGAGVGAAITLALAFRRQRHQEITTAHAAYDATERRVTELYTKAAEQLGHATPAVRLAGLYALERLAQDNPGHRQTIVNVICAYLRMPYTPPRSAAPERAASSPPGPWQSVSPAEPDPAPAGERQVRLTAQTILAEHLRDERRPNQALGLPASPRHWPGMRIDLTGATLIDVDFTGAHPAEALFAGATFVGETAFGWASFSGQARFDKAHFTDDTWFTGAKFAELAEFSAAVFSGGASFEDTTFASDALFYKATFSAHAHFTEATFADHAIFASATFNADAHFDEARFTEYARFDEAGFTGALAFDGAMVTEFTGSRENRAEWSQIADHPDHVWPPGWQLVDGLNGTTVLAREQRA